MRSAARNRPACKPIGLVGHLPDTLIYPPPVIGRDSEGLHVSSASLCLGSHLRLAEQ